MFFLLAARDYLVFRLYVDSTTLPTKNRDLQISAPVPIVCFPFSPRLKGFGRYSLVIKPSILKMGIKLARLGSSYYTCQTVESLVLSLIFKRIG